MNDAMRMIQTMRWYGPNDPVSLADIRQSGAEGIVTALHHFPNGEVWTEDEIQHRKQQIEKAGLTWTVVESVPVHEDIKTRTGNYQLYISNYQKTIENLGKCGIKTLCYNFMPILDWTRTDLTFQLPDGALALRFDMTELGAFDLYILKRKNAEHNYNSVLLDKAKLWYSKSSEKARDHLAKNILSGLPGSEEGYDLDSFKQKIASYNHISKEELKDNLSAFIKEIAPVAEKAEIRLAIHPDDPPFSLFGLPRIVSDLEDLNYLINAYNSPSNGLCFCTGSLGAGLGNQVEKMAEQLAYRTNFLHLRNVQKVHSGEFYEATHLGGDVDMYAVVNAFVEEAIKSKRRIPMRPDHGHQVLDDLKKTTNPGYSAIGRLKGLAELRGLELGIIKSHSLMGTL